MRSLAILATATMFAAPALAADDATTDSVQSFNAAERPSYAVKSTQSAGDWSGPYVGVQLGFGDFDVGGGGLNASDDGFVGGVHAGYNWDVGNYVVGGEIDIDGTDISLTGLGDVDTITRLKVRAGPEYGDTFLYGTVGAAYADGNGFGEWGWVAGIGLDWQVSPQWVLGGDVLYQEFDDVNAAGADLDGTTVRVRASFRF